eukprot:6803289-Prymnesium_polylepis.1
MVCMQRTYTLTKKQEHRDVGPQGVWTGMGGQQQPRPHENCAEGCQCYDICAPPVIIPGRVFVMIYHQ